VDESLNQMGVRTEQTARLDSKGEELPDNYSPLGSSVDVAKTDELFLVGLQLKVEAPDGGTETLDNRAALVELADDDTGVVGFHLTDAIAPGNVWEQDDTSPHPSFGGTTNGGQSARSITAGDIDGDGQEEIMIVYVDLDAPANADEIYVEVIDYATDRADATQTTLVIRQAGVTELAGIAGDFDADGIAELAIALGTESGSNLYYLQPDAAGNFDFAGAPVRSFPRRLTEGGIAFELAAGNIDNDNGDELVVVINEAFGQDTATAAYWILDDAATEFRTIDGDRSISGFDGGDYTAIVADVALGDIDADGKQEIVFGGLTGFTNNACESYEHLLIALDDAAAENPLGSLGAHVFRETYVEPGTGCNSNSHQLRVRKVFVNTLDVDGDGVAEIQANRHVYEDFVEAAPWTPAGPADAPYELPWSEFLEGSTVGGTVSDGTCQIVTGDVTGNGRDEIISFVQWNFKVNVYGLDGPDPDTAEWKLIQTMPTAFYNGQTRVFPIITPCNVDADGLALKYSDAEYEFVFTEPIIIAVLAAAPCASGVGQNTGACVTAYGQSETQEGGIDGTITVSASTFVGFEGKDPFLGIGGGVEERVTTSASFSAGRYYTLEETVEFETGPLEDTVVFTTIPLDRYTYEILSHPDPERIGEKIVVNVPRSPITLQVEREFFNGSVPEGSFQVGRNVFMHTPGDVDSYPTEGDADALIDTGGLGHLGPLGELVDSAGEALGPLAERLLGNGLKASRVTTVGQGGGQTSTEIRFSEQTTYRAGFEIAYDLEAKVTGGGAVVGGSVGGSVGAGLSWGNTSTSVYRGTVGSIDADNFAANTYSFGLFTYIYNYGDPSKQQFEVINYWVDR